MTSAWRGYWSAYMDGVRTPIVIEVRRKGAPHRIFGVDSGARQGLSAVRESLFVVGAVLLLLAVFGRWETRWAELASELGTAMFVVGLLVLNVERARSVGKALSYGLVCLLGIAGCGVVALGVVTDEQWVSVISHLAVGALAFVLLEVLLARALQRVENWADRARHELVVTLWPPALPKMEERKSPGLLRCARCRLPVVRSSNSYPEQKQMHWVCFHYAFEHRDGTRDPDQACSSQTCPARTLDSSPPPEWKATPRHMPEHTERP